MGYFDPICGELSYEELEYLEYEEDSIIHTD